MVYYFVWDLIVVDIARTGIYPKDYKQALSHSRDFTWKDHQRVGEWTPYDIRRLSGRSAITSSSKFRDPEGESFYFRCSPNVRDHLFGGFLANFMATILLAPSGFRVSWMR